MESIKAEIFIPSYGITVEFMLPAYVSVRLLIEQMIFQLSEYYGMKLCFDTVILDTVQKGVLDPERNLCSQGVKNGSKLYLI